MADVYQLSTLYFSIKLQMTMNLEIAYIILFVADVLGVDR